MNNQDIIRQKRTIHVAPSFEEYGVEPKVVRAASQQAVQQTVLEILHAVGGLANINVIELINPTLLQIRVKDMQHLWREGDEHDRKMIDNPVIDGAKRNDPDAALILFAHKDDAGRVCALLGERFAGWKEAFAEQGRSEAGQGKSEAEQHKKESKRASDSEITITVRQILANIGGIGNITRMQLRNNTLLEIRVDQIPTGHYRDLIEKNSMVSRVMTTTSNELVIIFRDDSEAARVYYEMTAMRKKAGMGDTGSPFSSTGRTGAGQQSGGSSQAGGGQQYGGTGQTSRSQQFGGSGQTGSGQQYGGSGQTRFGQSYGSAGQAGSSRSSDGIFKVTVTKETAKILADQIIQGVGGKGSVKNSVKSKDAITLTLKDGKKPGYLSTGGQLTGITGVKQLTPSSMRLTLQDSELAYLVNDRICKKEAVMTTARAWWSIMILVFSLLMFWRMLGGSVLATVAVGFLFTGIASFLIRHTGRITPGLTMLLGLYELPRFIGYSLSYYMGGVFGTFLGILAVEIIIRYIMRKS
ncbi:MAG: hypothetical protein IJ860_10440 [Eubacterium sp.]|nr:hypothetical protein [Eubacterium sp.]